VLVGLLAVAAVPGAIAAAELTEPLELIQAAGAIPGAILFGVGAIWLARRARRRSERTLGRVGGLARARIGRTLGLLALALAASAAIAVGVYELLTYLEY
jgi:hypothetical protein